MSNLFSFFILSFFIPAHHFSATYHVSKSFSFSAPSGKEKVVSVGYTGFLFQKNGRCIYFERPEYLQKYPEGLVVLQEGNSVSTLGMGSDSIQEIYYVDYDSLLSRWRGTYLPGEITNRMAYFDSGLVTRRATAWQLKDETKIINGLHCKKAIIDKQWMVWYCADIPQYFGVGKAAGLPGLMVEADRLADGRHYLLNNYSAEVVADTNFWPAVFNEPFFREKDITPGIPKKPGKESKRLDILNQEP